MQCKYVKSNGKITPASVTQIFVEALWTSTWYGESIFNSQFFTKEKCNIIPRFSQRCEMYITTNLKCNFTSYWLDTKRSLADSERHIQVGVLTPTYLGPYKTAHPVSAIFRRNISGIYGFCSDQHFSGSSCSYELLRSWREFVERVDIFRMDNVIIGDNVPERLKNQKK